MFSPKNFCISNCSHHQKQLYNSKKKKKQLPSLQKSKLRKILGIKIHPENSKAFSANETEKEGLGK